MTTACFVQAGSMLAAGLIAAAMVPQSSAFAQVGPVPGTDKPQPAPSQYLDLAQLQRDTNKEIMRSVQTGKPFDWAKVYRGALHPLTHPHPTTTAKHRHAKPRPKRVRDHRTRHRPRWPIHRPNPRDHQVRHTAAPVAASAPSSTKTRPPSKAPSASTPARHGSGRALPAQASPAAADRHRPTTSPRWGTASRPWRPGWWAALPLGLIPISLLALIGRRRLTPLFAANRPKPALASVRVVRNRSAAALPGATAPSGLDPFAVSALAVLGPGAASVVRGLVIALLIGRSAGSTEVVMSRTDAWNLFGIDLGDLVEERIPGLVLTDDSHQAATYLRTPGPRRLLVSCSAVLDLPRERGRVTALCLSPGPDDTIEVTDDGHISHTSNPHLADAVTEPLPTLARPEAYAQLMTLPTVRTSAPLETRMRPPG